MSVLIKGGRVVTAVDDYIADVWIEGETIREIGADLLIYQDLDALKAAVRAANPALVEFEASCFDGRYITPRAW